MKRVFKKEELMNMSMDQFKALIKPNGVLKYSHKVLLNGNEIVEAAVGGELIRDMAGSYSVDENKHEPAGIRFPDGSFVSLQSIEEMIIEE